MSQHAIVSETAAYTVSRPKRGAIARVGAVLTAAVAFSALLLGPAAPALAHDQLVGTELVTNADGKTEAIRLSFNNSLIEVGAEFVLTGADGKDATGGAPVIAGPDVTQPIAAGLDEGDYAGAWRVVSSDGHPIEGAFTFALDGAGKGELKEAALGNENTDSKKSEDSEGTKGETGTADDRPAAPASLYISLAVGGVLVAGVVIAAVVARSRRLAQLEQDSTKGQGGQ